MDRARVWEMKQRVQSAQNILVLSHIRPDGDAVGSLLGLGLAFQAADKSVDMVLADGVPYPFRGLSGIERVKTRPKGKYDFICVVDCSELKRVGDILEDGLQPDVNIDHHATNLDFAKINIVDTEAVSTTEIIAGILPELGLEIDQAVAEALLTGLITDSIGFRTSNVTPKAMRLAAALMELGADLAVLYQRALVNRSFESMLFWSAGLGKLEREGPLVWTTLTQSDRDQANYPGRDDADLVNVLSAIDGAEIAIIFVEQPNESVKVSWRSQPGIDVSKIAVDFGGGGHPRASGADVSGKIQFVKAAVLRATRAILNGQSDK